MSVSGGGPGGEPAYDEVEVQHISRNNNVPGDGTSYVYRTSYGPVGDSLGRGEAAELVGMKVNVFLWAGGGNARAHARYQLGLTPQVEWNEAGLGYGNDGTLEAFDSDPAGNTGAGSQAGGNFVSDVQNDVWLMLQPHQFGPMEDTASGTGHAGSIHMAHMDFNFREMFSRGPIVDRHNDLWEVFYASDNNSNADVSVYRTHILYWNVFEDR